MPGKPLEDKSKSQQQEIADLKDQYLVYFAELPVQKLAAAFIGRSADTIQIWAKDDLDFSARVDKAKAEWARRKARRVNEQFLLERLMKEEFAQRTEVTGPGGGPVTLAQLVLDANHQAED